MAGAVETGDQPEQRRLAATGSADSATISLSRTVRLMSQGAAYHPRRFSRGGRGSASERVPARVLPAHQRAWSRRPECCREFSQQREGDDRRQDVIGPAHLLAVDQQITQALRRAHDFGRDHEHESEAEARAQGDQGLWQAPPAAGYAAPSQAATDRKTRPTSMSLRSTDRMAPATPR